jgi:hypothetical protein
LPPFLRRIADQTYCNVSASVCAHMRKLSVVPAANAGFRRRRIGVELDAHPCCRSFAGGGSRPARGRLEITARRHDRRIRVRDRERVPERGVRVDHFDRDAPACRE